MTVRQKQWQLYYLGFLEKTGEIDGIWGPLSEAATVKFQQTVGIKADGVFGPSTEDKSREIIDAIQDVVAAFAAEPLVNDGLAGIKTMEATMAYQKAMGLPATGIADAETRALILNTVALVPQETPESGDWWDNIEYFTPEEFKCKCGGRYCNGYPAEMRKDVVRVSDRARKYFGRPGHIISGLRCPQHNANSGGVANSQHMYGEAIDLYIEGVSGDALLAFVKAQPEIRYAYKINSTNVHFDIPKGAR